MIDLKRIILSMAFWKDAEYDREDTREDSIKEAVEIASSQTVEQRPEALYTNMAKLYGLVRAFKTGSMRRFSYPRFFKELEKASARIAHYAWNQGRLAGWHDRSNVNKLRGKEPNSTNPYRDKL